MVRRGRERPLSQLNRVRVTHPPVRVGFGVGIGLKSNKKTYWTLIFGGGRLISAPCHPSFVVPPSCDIRDAYPICRMTQGLSVNVTVLDMLADADAITGLGRTYYTAEMIANQNAKYVCSLYGIK